MTALVPVICALIGALVYLLSGPSPAPGPLATSVTSRTKFAELGRLLFLASVIALMFAYAGKSTHVF